MPTGARSQRRRPTETGSVAWGIVAVLALLLFLALIPVRVGNDPDEMREVTARTWTRILADSARSFLSHHGRAPASPAQLLATDSMGWQALEALEPDPWGTPYHLAMQTEPSRFVATAAGPNRRFGDDDDISSESVVR